MKPLQIGISAILLIVSSVRAQYIPPPRNPKQLREVQPPNRKSTVEFRGNLNIGNERLRLAAQIPPDEIMDADSAKKAAAVVEDFYHQSGFTLARVFAIQEPKGWVFSIDEGVLYSVSIYGAGWWDTFLLRQTLLPNEIFYAPMLEERLAHWLEQNPGYTVRYELTERAVSEDKLLSSVNPIRRYLSPSETLAQLRDQSQHALLIYIERSEERTGVDFGVGYSSANKIELNMQFDKGSTFVDKDRIEVGMMAGLARRSTIDPAESGSSFYSNAAFRAQWFTPPVATSWLKFVPEVGVSNKNEQRPDLPLDRFQTLQTFADLGIAGEWAKYRYAYLASGYDLKHVFDVETIPSDPYTVAHDTAQGLRVRTGVKMMFSPPRENRLLNDTIQSELLWHRQRDVGQFLEWTGRFQKVFITRKADYILQSRAVLQMGDVQFFDEVPITRLGMAASFGRKFWVQRGANVGGEARFNLWGNKIQAGLLADAAPFGLIDHVTNNQKLEAAFAVGPVGYVQLFDAFQLSLGVAAGFATTGDSSYDLDIGFDKIF